MVQHGLNGRTLILPRPRGRTPAIANHITAAFIPAFTWVKPAKASAHYLIKMVVFCNR